MCDMSHILLLRFLIFIGIVENYVGKDGVFIVFWLEHEDSLYM